MKSPRSRSRLAMSIIELLVVIAIISILIAILLPAIQKMRIAAAKTETANKMRQLMLAVHTYHDANKYLPFNGDSVSGKWANQTATSGSWGYQILPYLDLGALYEALGTGNDPSSGQARIIATTRAPSVFLDSLRGRVGYVSDDKQKVHGPGTDFAINPYINAPLSSYHPDNPDPVKFPDKPNWQPNRMRSIDSVQDGASNTLFLASRYWPVSKYDDTTNDWPAALNLGGDTSSCILLFNNASKDSTILMTDTVPIAPQPTSAYRHMCVFGGPLAEGAHMAFLDGSVHFVPFDLNGSSIAPLAPILLPDDGLTVPLPE